jgi:hypothetical protein
MPSFAQGLTIYQTPAHKNVCGCLPLPLSLEMGKELN